MGNLVSKWQRSLKLPIKLESVPVTCVWRVTTVCDAAGDAEQRGLAGGAGRIRALGGGGRQGDRHGGVEHKQVLGSIVILVILVIIIIVIIIIIIIIIIIVIIFSFVGNIIGRQLTGDFLVYGWGEAFMLLALILGTVSW